MSTCYRFVKPVPFKTLRAALDVGELAGLVRHTSASKSKTAKTEFMITDGTNFLSASTKNATDTALCRYGSNNVEEIIKVLESKFGAILSEHDKGFFGDADSDFETGKSDYGN